MLLAKALAKAAKEAEDEDIAKKKAKLEREAREAESQLTVLNQYLLGKEQLEKQVEKLKSP